MVEIYFTPLAGFITTTEYDADGNPIYIGEANPGTGKGSAGWRIRKIIYDADGNITDIQYADGDANFDNIWNNRASYSYS